jgi:hypothetical protein
MSVSAGPSENSPKPTVTNRGEPQQDHDKARTGAGNVRAASVRAEGDKKPGAEDGGAADKAAHHSDPDPIRPTDYADQLRDPSPRHGRSPRGRPASGGLVADAP